MKIEKVNENQIRCTLTREDLASRELKISELAYGTEKAKSVVSRAKTIPQALLKLLPRPFLRRVTVYAPACSVWNL